MPERQKLVLHYQSPEAKGTLVVNPGSSSSYGPSFILPHLNDEAVGWVDFFERSDATVKKEGERYCQFIFYDGKNCDEPIVKIVYFDDGRVMVVVNPETVQGEDVDSVGIYHKQSVFYFPPNQEER